MRHIFLRPPTFIAYPTQVGGENILQIHPRLNHRAGMIVLGTIVPIRYDGVGSLEVLEAVVSDVSRSAWVGIQPLAPATDEFTEYDAAQMLTYARLLDAQREGHGWQAAARDILLLDVEADEEAAERCWRSHYDRALWSVGDGLVRAAEANARACP